MNRLLAALLTLAAAAPAAGSDLDIESVDAAFFPKIGLTVSLPRPLTSPADLVVTDGDRPVAATRIAHVPGREDAVLVSYLSTAMRPGRRYVEVRLDDARAESSYLSPRGRRLGDQAPQLRLLVTGPGGVAVPCRMVALHEEGATLEDVTSADGFGLRETLRAAPPGRSFVELKLAGLDLPLFQFPVDLGNSGTRTVRCKLGYLRLPGPADGLADRSTVFLEIDRTPGRTPLLRAPLTTVLAALPPEVPADMLPLAPGIYRIRLGAARGTLPPARRSVELVEVVADKVATLSPCK